MEILDVVVPLVTFAAVALSVPLLVQFTNNVSRNMSQTDTNVTEEITKVAKDEI